MKADLLAFAAQPRKEQRLALLQPLLDKPPTVIEDLEAVVQAYIRAAGAEAGLVAMKILVARTDISKAAVRRVRQLVARQMMDAGNLDEALVWMEAAVKDMEPETEAGASIGGARFIADVWGMKAAQLVRPNGSVETQDRDKFDQFFKEADTWNRKAVELENKYMPIDLRGTQASLYLTFLLGSKKFENAKVWLEKYLHDEKMPA
jgi:hypothetical protein